MVFLGGYGVFRVLLSSYYVLGGYYDNARWLLWSFGCLLGSCLVTRAFWMVTRALLGDCLGVSKWSLGRC